MLNVSYLNCAEIAWAGEELEKIRLLVDDDTFRLAMNCKNRKVAMTKLLGELILRHLLARFHGLQKGDFSLLRNEHGKPYLVGVAGIHYNISHSGDYIVCALSDSEIGVDIERRTVSRMAVARRFFHPKEIICLERCSGEKQRELFFNYWSVKESYLKYTGSGLSRSLSSFSVNFSKDRIVLCENELPLSVNVQECSVDPGYACFVCGRTVALPEIARLAFEQLL